MKTMASEPSNLVDYAPKLKRVLKSYQATATNSLSGPSSALFSPSPPASSPSSSSSSSNGPYSKAQPAASVSASASAATSTTATTTTNNNTNTNTNTNTTTTNSFTSDICSNPKSIANPTDLHRKVPLIVPADDSRGEFSETLLDGEWINCFVVGGERRLCLPQILNSVLKDVSIFEMNAVCNHLKIYYSRCTSDQLSLLKRQGIIPPSAPSCGLITQTDAERLVASLVDAKLPSLDDVIKQLNDSSIKEDQLSKTIPVYHECFGRCAGLYRPALYLKPDSPCIECTECSRLLPPHKFVRHTHKARNSQTCHWGFDSANWRYYILLATDHQSHATGYTSTSGGCCASSSPLESALEEMKMRFIKTRTPARSPLHPLAKRKDSSRKEGSIEERKTDSPPVVKKSKSESPPLLVPSYHLPSSGVAFYPYSFGWPTAHPSHPPDVFFYPSSSKALEAAKTLASIHQYQKLVKSQPPTEAKSFTCDSLTAGLLNLLKKHHVDPDLKDKIMSEVNSIIDQVQSTLLPQCNGDPMAISAPVKVAQLGRIS